MDEFLLVYQPCVGVGPPLHYLGCRQIHDAVILGPISEKSQVLPLIDFWGLTAHICRSHGQSDVQRLLAPCAARRMNDV